MHSSQTINSEATDTKHAVVIKIQFVLITTCYFFLSLAGLGQGDWSGDGGGGGGEEVTQTLSGLILKRRRAVQHSSQTIPPEGTDVVQTQRMSS